LGDANHIKHFSPFIVPLLNHIASLCYIFSFIRCFKSSGYE